jgi:hypothetical protein
MRSILIAFVITLSLVVSPSASLAYSAELGQASDGIVSIDERFAELAQQVPGFGGMFYDESGQLSMYLVESQIGRQQQAKTAVTTLLGDDARIASAGKIQIIPGQYDYLQLSDWHARMRADILAAPGVNLLDLDEASNRLRVGIESEQALGLVEKQLAALGIPREAVNIEVTEPIQFAATLRDRRRPLVGGLQINFGNFLCTLGFIATRAQTQGMVTNSHCTNVQGGTEGTVYHQPVASGTTNRIGQELADPAYFTGAPCPAGRRCRYSDSSFARIPHPSGPAVTVSRGLIARTTGLGSITIAGTNPNYRVVSEAAFPLAGEVLNKVGRTTGWSQGTVAATCVSTNVSGTNITQLCQDFVNARVGPGDSGSPVFRIINSPAARDVRLYGVLWGGNTSGTQFVFSAMSNMQRTGELGALTTCAAGFSC